MKHILITQAEFDAAQDHAGIAYMESGAYYDSNREDFEYKAMCEYLNCDEFFLVEPTTELKDMVAFAGVKAAQAFLDTYLEAVTNA